MRGFAKAGLIGTALLGAMATTASAEIKCQDGSQLIQGNWMATPYCQDKLLAQVANARGFKTSFAAIRNNPNHKKELCRFLYTRYPRADDVHGRGRAGVLRRRPLGGGAQRLGIGEDLRVVEGDGLRSPVGDPFGSGGVIARMHVRPVDAGQIGDRAGMAAGIAVRVGIDADKPQGAHIEPCFFLQFAAAGVPRRSRPHRRSRREARSSRGTGSCLRRISST